VNTSAQPAVSVCIANYNGEQLLVDCIDSVLAQREGIEIEIIVHDDASTDASVALLRQRYPQVKLICSPDNVGFCVANNRMVREATGTYILLLNNDAALFDDALETLLAAARQRDAPGILSLSQFDWETGELVDRGCLLDPSYFPVPVIAGGSGDVAYVIGACLWISRQLWHELGGLPEWMDSIGEDLYLCCLARLTDRSVSVPERSGYRHRQGASFGGNRVTVLGLQSTFRRRLLSERNRTYALIIATPTPLVWPWLLGHIAALIMEGFVLTLLRCDVRILRQIYLPAIAGVLARWTLLREHRSKVQASRKVSLLCYLRPFTVIPQKLRLLMKFGVPRLAGAPR